MTKKGIILTFTILLLIVVPLTTLEVSDVAYSPKNSVLGTTATTFTRAEASTPPTTVEAKKPIVAKKPVVKKKVAKRKGKRREKLTIAPPLITVDTAPHSPKPIARRKTTNKKKS